MTNVVEVTQLGKHFSEQWALRGLSFSLAEGELLALLGHNGAGKTTLIKQILGLVVPDEGQVRVLGKDPADKAHRGELSMGYLPEQVNLYDNLSGFEVLQYFAKLRGCNDERVDALLQQQGLAAAAHQRVATYSKGMKQRLGLAQALLTKPKLLLLDEPTVGLDPSASMAFYQQIADLRQQGTAVIICTHELTLIEPHLDRALILAKGQNRGLGTLVELQQRSGLRSKLQLPDSLPPLLGSDPYIRQYDRNEHAIHFAPSEQAELVQHLCNHCGCSDFSIATVGLGEIYHHCQQQELSQ
ncbi:ABC transporter ATP-binding protein [Ferrimonas lipolytica]|uniref:ABC transporter ATP-binding protein n=1 Tax=Ferrimonas lipolytica TaxID=2724191 RepID=A0A6H1U8Y3_9GAMM|nr:ABC transporter ATP-binding protein [Ferrimonas lipolytica]QIZ75484.1 ABC transporter ATP-binding protein [Ferrimonas lipolytica]